MKTPKTTALQRKVGSILSAPARFKHGERGRKAEADRKSLKFARAYDDAPSHNERGIPTEAFYARQHAQDIRDKYKKNPIR